MTSIKLAAVAALATCLATGASADIVRISPRADARSGSSANAQAAARARSDSSSVAAGGNASVTFEARRQFTPEGCPQTLQHCQILAEADALWAAGMYREARLHLRLIPAVAETMTASRRLVMND